MLGELGRGGMGVVYRAEDERLGRQVALKVLPEALARDPRAKDRLLAEARAAATLDHPNVCTVYEVAETDEGQPFIALACYDGETLADRLARGPLAVDEAVRVVRGIAAGVAAAHARDIVHRDLKPSNVFLCEDSTPKVLDFGIAKQPDVALTRTGETAGTLAYGAPEQAQGVADARSDVWALGVVLYEVLTGRQPFQAPYGAAVLYAVLHEDPPPPSSLADLPPALDAVVARCLAKDPAARYADARSLADALDGVLAPDAPARAPLESGAWAVGLRGSRRAVALAVAVLLGLLAVGWWAARGSSAEGLPSAIHLAIVPPDPLPDGADDRAFAEGLAEGLAGGLDGMVPPDRDVWVVPASEVRAFDVTSAREAGTVLGANLVVTGSLRRDGDALTLALSLTTADDRPRLIDASTITVAGADRGSLRSRALGQLAEMLGFQADADAPSTPTPRRSGTTSWAWATSSATARPKTSTAPSTFSNRPSTPTRRLRRPMPGSLRRPWPSTRPRATPAGSPVRGPPPTAPRRSTRTTPLSWSLAPSSRWRRGTPPGRWSSPAARWAWPLAPPTSCTLWPPRRRRSPIWRGPRRPSRRRHAARRPAGPAPSTWARSCSASTASRKRPSSSAR